MTNQSQDSGAPSSGFSRARIGLAGFALVAIVAAALGYAFYRHQLSEDRDAAFQELTAVVEMKVDQIEAWLWERRNDAKLLSSVRRFGIDLEEMIVLGQVLHQSPLYRFLSTSSSVYGYRSAFGLDPEGNVAFTMGNVASNESAPAPLARRAIERNQIIVSSLYRDESTTERTPLLDVAVPLHKAPDMPPTGVVVLRINARAFFLPLIKQMPLSLSASQIHLVRRDRDEILHLSEETHEGEGFPARVPAKDESVASVQAIQRAGERIDAMDHRGIRVLAASRAIEGSDWVLLAKMDASIVEARALKATFVVAVILLLLLGGGGGFIAMRWAHRERQHGQRLRLERLERDALVHHFDYLAKYANDAIVLMDGEFRIREVNERVSALLGYSRDELLWTDGKRLRAPDLQDRHRVDWAAAGSPGGVIFETRLLHKNGTTIPVEVSGRLIQVEDGRYYQAIIRDITERKEAEARIERASRTKKALSEINSAIIHADDEQALFQRVCTILAEHGGFAIAGVGVADPNSGDVRWVAAAGAGAAEFVQSPRSVRADCPEGQGPTGVAFRERRPVIVQEFLNDPLTAHWKDLGRSLGIGSTAVFPILQAGHAVGVINVISGATGAFDSEIVELLAEATKEVSFALDNFVRDRARREAEIALKQSEDRYRELTELSADWVWEMDADGRFTHMSQRFFDLSGLKPEQLIGRRSWETDALPESRKAVADLAADIEARRPFRDIRFARSKANGEPIWIEVSGNPVFGPIGEYLGFRGTSRDVSNQVRAEQGLRESEARQRQVLENIDEVMYVVDVGDELLNGKMRFVSTRVKQILGYEPQELFIADRAFFLGVLHPDDVATVEHQTRELLATGEATTREFRVRSRLTGGYRWVEDRVVPQKNSRGQVLSLVGVLRDVTVRRAAERRIKHLTRLYALLSNTNKTIVHARSEQELFDRICQTSTEHDGMFGSVVRLADPESKRLLVAACSESMLPITARSESSFDPAHAEFKGQIATAYLEDRIVVDNEFSGNNPATPLRAITYAAGIRSVAVLPIRRDGKPIGVFSLNAAQPGFFDPETHSLLEEMATGIAFALDNFDYERRRKHAEHSLHESEARFRALTALSSDYFWEIDEHLRYRVISEGVRAILGFEPQELIGKSSTETHLIERLNPPPEDFARIRAEHKPYHNTVARIRAKDGSHRILNISADPLFGADGAFVGYRGVTRDISASVKAETALRQSEEQFRGLVEQSVTGIVIAQEELLTYVNPRAVEIFGYGKPEEVLGHKLMEFVSEQDRTALAESIGRLLSREVRSAAFAFTGLRKDGTTADIGAHGTHATYRGRPAIIGVIQDITERKRAEEGAKRYLEEIEAAMMATVRVASTMGEMRDPYTAGHERRVAELTAAMGEEMGLSASQIEGLRVAGNLHDISKITVPAEILSKPGKISAVEFSLIKEHAQQGYEILKDVRFPWPVAEVAQQHHERLDGSGYPQGLKGDEIVLEARILAVADTVEAMSSHRPYRPGRGIEASLAEIEQYRGIRYDAEAVDACLRLFREKEFQFPV